MNRLQRFFTHLFALPLQARRCFPQASLDRIQDAIARSEQQHRGEIRFVVEHGLDLADVLRGQSAHERATQWFSDLRVWDTADNTGILIYVLLAEKDIEILADRGINQQVPADFWEQICATMTRDFQSGQFEAGVLKAIERMTRILVERFPSADTQNPDELPNRPVLR